MNPVGATGIADIAALPQPARCMAQNRRQPQLSAKFSRQSPIEPASPALRCESWIRRDPNQRLAEVLAAQHLGEGRGDNL
jgi:hypothetical protein